MGKRLFKVRPLRTFATVIPGAAETRTVADRDSKTHWGLIDLDCAWNTEEALRWPETKRIIGQLGILAAGP